METISLIVAWFFIVLIGYFALRMVWCIGQNLYEGLVLRRKLRERLSGMRLEQALERAGSDPTLYLHDKQMHEIEQQMRNCENCQVTETCDGALKANTPAERFNFCPNYVDLFKPNSRTATVQKQATESETNA